MRSKVKTQKSIISKFQSHERFVSRKCVVDVIETIIDRSTNDILLGLKSIVSTQISR